MLSKKLQKVKIRSTGFNLTKKKINSTEISNQSSKFIFFGIPSFLALIILSPETVKLNVTKNNILGDLVGVLALV